MEEKEKSYTRADLRVMYYAGRSTSHGYGRDKTTTYRSGVQTRAGDLEESEWLKEAEALVVRENGASELDALIKITSSLAWLRNDKERRRYALELYMTKPSGNQITTVKKSTQERER
jgi:hypothetical protein